jgi:hypothetical protein
VRRRGHKTSRCAGLHSRHRCLQLWSHRWRGCKGCARALAWLWNGGWCGVERPQQTGGRVRNWESETPRAPSDSNSASFQMTGAMVVGCLCIAYGPSLVLLLGYISRRSALLVLSIISSFVWLLAILAASIIWIAVPPLKVGAL